MFYSQFILAKKGPLGTIWIAAHLERKLRKNQVADTDIGVSVDSILFPEAPIALRLSSHLLLGVVRIYSKKVNYLFHDCSEALLKIKQAFRSTAIDLPPEESTAPYHSITLPETFQLDDFELPDSTLNNFIDHHVSTKEAITLQDTLNTAECSTSQFGLDERFGDGDVSQMGFDLDEDLFLDKGLSSQPNVIAQISGQDTLCLDQPSIDLVDMDVGGHHVEHIEGSSGARLGDLSEFISNDGDGHLQQNGDLQRRADPFQRHGFNPQTPDLNEVFTAVQPTVGLSSFGVSSPERIDIDHAPPTPGIVEGTIPANEEGVPDPNPQESGLPSIDVEFAKDATSCHPFAISECPNGTKNNDYLHPVTKVLNLTNDTQLVNSSSSGLPETSGLVNKFYDSHKKFGEEDTYNLQQTEMKNSEDTDQGLGKGGIIFPEAANLEHHVSLKHLDKASNMVMSIGTGVDSSEQATYHVPLSTVYVTETTAEINNSMLNGVPRVSTNIANDVSESASCRFSSPSFLKSDFNLRSSSMQSKHSDVLSIDGSFLPANAPIIHIGEPGQVCPASHVPLTSVLVKEKILCMNSDITTFNGEAAPFIFNEQKHVHQADRHISGAAIQRSDSAYFNLQSDQVNVVENRNLSDNAAKVPSQYFQTSNLPGTAMLPVRETIMDRNSCPVNAEAANFTLNEEIHEIVSGHTLGTSVLNPSFHTEPSFQPNVADEFSVRNRIVADNTSDTGTPLRQTTAAKNGFTVDEARHFHLDVENHNLEVSCRIPDRLAQNSDFNSRSSLLSNHASALSAENRDFPDNALCKGSSLRERTVENNISMLNEGVHIPSVENHAHQAVSCQISGVPVLNSDFNIGLGSQSSNTNALLVGKGILLDNTLDSGTLAGESTVKRDIHMINEGAGCLIPTVENHVPESVISGMSLPRSDLNLKPNCSQSSQVNVLSFDNRGSLDNVHDTATSVRETVVDHRSSGLNGATYFTPNMENHAHELPSYAYGASVLKSDLNLRPSSSLSNQVTPSSVESILLPDNIACIGSIHKPELNFRPFNSQLCQTSLSAENMESLENISGTVIKDPSQFCPPSHLPGSSKLERETTAGTSSTSLNKEADHLIPNSANHMIGPVSQHISSSSTITSKFNIAPLSSQSKSTLVLSAQCNAPPIHVREQRLHSANSSTVVQGQSLPSAHTMHRDEQSTGIASKMAYFDYQNRSSSSEFCGPEKMVVAPVGNINLNDFSCLTGERGFVESSASVERINKISGKKRQFMDSTPVLQSCSSSKLPGRQNFSKSNEYVPPADDKLASILVGRTSAFRMEPTPTTQKTTSFKRPRLNSAVGLKKRKVLLDDAMVLHADSIRLQLMNTEDIRRLRRKAPCTRPEIWIIEKCSSEEIFEESVLTGISAELYTLYSRSHIWNPNQMSKVKTQYNVELINDAAFTDNSQSARKRDVNTNGGLSTVISSGSPSVMQGSVGAAGVQTTNNFLKQVAQQELQVLSRNVVCTTPSGVAVSAEAQNSRDVFSHDTQGHVAPQADIHELHVLGGNVVCTIPVGAAIYAEAENSRDVFSHDTQGQVAPQVNTLQLQVLSGNEVCTATPDVAVVQGSSGVFRHDAQEQARPQAGILDLQGLSCNDVCTDPVSDKFVLPWKDGSSSYQENGVTPAAYDTITKDPIHTSKSFESCHGKDDDAYRIPQRPTQNMVSVSGESIERNGGMLSCGKIVPVEVPQLLQDSVSEGVVDDTSFPCPTRKTSLRNEKSFSHVDPSTMVARVDQTSAEGINLDDRACLNISAVQNAMTALYNAERADKNSQINLDHKGDNSVVGVIQNARTLRDATVSTASVATTTGQQVMEKEEHEMLSFCKIVPAEVRPLLQDSGSKEVVDDTSFPCPMGKTSIRSEESISHVDGSTMVTRVDQISAEGINLDDRACLNIYAVQNAMTALHTAERADTNSQINLDKDEDSFGVIQNARTVWDIATFPSSSSDGLAKAFSTASAGITTDQQVTENEDHGALSFCKNISDELPPKNYSSVHHMGDNCYPPAIHEASVNADDSVLVVGQLGTEDRVDKMPTADGNIVGQDEVHTHLGGVQNAMTMLDNVAVLSPGLNTLNEIVMPMAVSITDQEEMKKNNEVKLAISVDDEVTMQKLLINVEGPAREMPGGSTHDAVSYSAWTCTETENIPSTVKENSEVQDLNQGSGMDMDDVPSNLDATKEASDFCSVIIDNATEFLNVDDEDVEKTDGAGTNDVRDPQGTQSLENSGWSSRTRGVAKYLKSLFNDEHGHGRKAVAVDHLLTGKTRKEASRMFFETLVLKTRDYIDVKQENPYDFIHINPRTKLLKSDF